MLLFLMNQKFTKNTFLAHCKITEPLKGQVDRTKYKMSGKSSLTTDLVYEINDNEYVKMTYS